MKHGRKTTFKERLEIVQYTLANDKDYQKTIDKYKVSYSQVYSWVRKFEKDREVALQDKRGRALRIVNLKCYPKLNASNWRSYT